LPLELFPQALLRYSKTP